MRRGVRVAGVGIDDVCAHGTPSTAHLGRLPAGWLPQGRIREYGVPLAAITPVIATPACRGTVVSVEDGLARLDLTVSPPDGTVTLRGRAVIAN
ncbi:hypothetical protein ACH41E_24110 [Streptomyces sp. NPDC020412]|uniref:hypothetical protein n=1 Tax=Streptomyces sp. NPDC020412 TaxID=3365073 RepID=UPI0037B8897C